MSALTTITISKETKKLLERIKGNKSWDVFLRELAIEYERLKRKKLAEEYLKRRPMSEEEAKSIMDMVVEGRKSWESRKN